MNLSAAPKGTCAQGSPPVTATQAVPGEETGALWPRHLGNRRRQSSSDPRGPRSLQPPPAHSSPPSPEACPFPGLGSKPTPSQPKALPVSEASRSPKPTGDKPRLLNHHSRPFPMAPSPALGSSLYASSWAHLPRNTSSYHDLSKSPLLQGPVQRPPPSGCFPNCPQPSCMFLHILDPCNPIDPANLALGHVGCVCLPPWPRSSPPTGPPEPPCQPAQSQGSWVGGRSLSSDLGALPTARPAWAPLTCTPKMPKMMKKAQQMRTMLPMGLREEMSVSTTSFRPGARLMTLQAGESRGSQPSARPGVRQPPASRSHQDRTPQAQTYVHSRALCLHPTPLASTFLHVETEARASSEPPRAHREGVAILGATFSPGLPTRSHTHPHTHTHSLQAPALGAGPTARCLAMLAEF